jgi:hypothetical protein
MREQVTIFIEIIMINISFCHDILDVIYVRLGTYTNDENHGYCLKVGCNLQNIFGKTSIIYICKGMSTPLIPCID